MPDAIAAGAPAGRRPRLALAKAPDPVAHPLQCGGAQVQEDMGVSVEVEGGEKVTLVDDNGVDAQALFDGSPWQKCFIGESEGFHRISRRENAALLGNKAKFEQCRYPAKDPLATRMTFATGC